jgi:hypothetical protein
MNGTREQVSVALFTLIQAAIQKAMPGYFNTFDRTPRQPSEVATDKEPSLSLWKYREAKHDPQAFGAAQYDLFYWVLVYARASSDPTFVWETQCNAIEDILDAALQSVPPGNAQTLWQQNNGAPLVANAWIDGTTLIDNAIIDTQLGLYIPIHVLTGR